LVSQLEGIATRSSQPAMTLQWFPDYFFGFWYKFQAGSPVFQCALLQTCADYFANLFYVSAGH